MATNPMQRKARVSFFLGMLITLLITGCIIVILIMQIAKTKQQIDAMNAQMKTAYILKDDLKSGDKVTEEMFESKKVNRASIPSNALTQEDFTKLSADMSNNEQVQTVYDVILKIDLKAGTVITTDMLTRAGELTEDVRHQEYNMILIPTQLEEGDYVDIRLRTPQGADYIVVTRKKITIPVIDGVQSSFNVAMDLKEDEIVAMSSAIIEAYQIKGALLYATKYVDPGLQTTTTATYVPNDAAIALMSQNPNITNEAKNVLFNRYNAARQTVRENGINGVLQQFEEDRLDNIEAGVEEQITKAQEERELYLQALAGE